MGQIEQRELQLFADNTSELYPQLQSIQANLANKMANDQFVKSNADKLLMYWVDNAAKRYVKEVGSPGDVWHKMFDKSDRLKVARDKVDEIEAEYKSGELDHMLTEAARNRREKRHLAKSSLSYQEAQDFAFANISAGEATRNKIFGPRGFLGKLAAEEMLGKRPDVKMTSRKWAKEAVSKAQRWFGYGHVGDNVLAKLSAAGVSEYEDLWRDGHATGMAQTRSATKRVRSVFDRIGKALDCADKAKTQERFRDCMRRASKLADSIGGFAHQEKIWTRAKYETDQYGQKSQICALVKRVKELEKRGGPKVQEKRIKKLTKKGDGTGWNPYPPGTPSGKTPSYKPGSIVRVGKAYRMGDAPPWKGKHVADGWEGLYTVVAKVGGNDYALSKGTHGDAEASPDVYMHESRLKRARRTRQK